MITDFKKLLGYDDKKKFTKGKTGLDLLKERFGHSVSTNEREVDNREKIHEKLNDKFNFDDVGSIKSFKVQHQEQIEEKQKIIENLKIETSESANKVLALEKEKVVILEELNKSKWMENTVVSSTKKLYEDKIRTIVDEFKSNYVDGSNLIPLLTTVSRRKQGNQKLNYGDWLKIPENGYLFKINENIAKRIFEDTNVLIDRAIGNLNRFKEQRRTRGGDEPVDKNYSLQFTGDHPKGDGGTGEHVVTTFDPVAHELYNGFTVSYWVKPNDNMLGTYFFAVARKSFGPVARFEFGITNATKLFIGVGTQRKDDTPHGMTEGNWYNWIITFAGATNGELKAYRNGTDIDLASYGAGQGTSTWDPGNPGDDDVPIYFGARNVEGDDPDNGWAMNLDEVAIFDEVKDVSTIWDGSETPLDLTNESGLVGYWKFNEGSGTTVEDFSTNNNYGTLTVSGSHTVLPAWSEDTPTT